MMNETQFLISLIICPAFTIMLAAVFSNIKAMMSPIYANFFSISSSFVPYITDRLDGIGKLAGIPLHFATRFCLLEMLSR